MLAPKKVKHRKVQKGRMKGFAWAGNEVDFGEWGLIATSCGWITARQIEAARVAVNRTLRRGGRIWIRIFPDKPLTKKPAETRMGKGKGSPEEWVCVIRPGRVLYEVDGVSEELALKALDRAARKLPVATRIVRRGEILL